MKLNVFPLLALVLLLTLAGCKPAPHGDNSFARSSRESSSARERMPRIAAATGNFDFFLLNLSWSPEYCHSHREAAECAARSTFVLHGLWPQNNNGTYPENCGNGVGPSDPAAFRDIYPEAGLLEHEWKQHGSCSGLSANEFFTAARKAYRSITIPPALANISSQTAMPPEQIVSLFTQSNPGLRSDSVAISCGHNYLTAVEICMDKSLHPIACQQVRSCRGNSVRIAPPQ